MSSGELEGSDETLTALSWGTQESGAGGLRGDARAGRSDEQKSPSTTADEASPRGRHGSRQGQRGHDGGRQEKVGAEPSGLVGNKGGHKASGVDPESHRVGEGEGGREASGVAENPREVRHRVGGGVELPQDAGNPRVAEDPRGDETPGAPTASQYRRGEDGRGQGGGNENPPTARATRRQGPKGGDGISRGKQTVVRSATMETAPGDGGRRRRQGAPARTLRRRRRRQDRKRHAPAPRVR